MPGRCVASGFVLGSAAKSQNNYRRNIYHSLRNIALLQRTLFAIDASLAAWPTVKLIHFDNASETAFAERVRLNQQGLIFDARLWRCYRTLHFIACRVLGGPERAEEAIGNYWSIASRHSQRLEHEGEFHSWLLRVLIDEASVLLRESTPIPKVLCESRSCADLLE